MQRKELETKAETLVKSFESAPHGAAGRSFRTAVIVVIIILAGIASGWGIAKSSGSSVGGLKSSEMAQQTGIAVGDIIGVQDEKSFRDHAEGVLVEGGVGGEGSHHLLREGGKSQNVYLTSSVVELNLFIGNRVTIWGETFSAQKAGWLMDVGRVKVLELNAKPPFEE